MKAVLLSLLMFSIPAFAQHSLLIDVTAYTAANLADGITTASCPHCTEVGSPYLYGRHPTALSYFLPAIAIEGAQAFVAWKLGHSRHKTWRALGRTQFWTGTAAHASGFVLNLTAR